MFRRKKDAEELSCGFEVYMILLCPLLVKKEYMRSLFIII